MGDSAIYLLGATSDAGLNSKGAYFLQWTMIRWLKRTGIKSYDLGGIDPEGNPGVYHFKRGISGVDICQIEPVRRVEQRRVLCDGQGRDWPCSARFALLEALSPCPRHSRQSSCNQARIMPPSTESVEISVVIVAWNAKHYLELCLDSLAKAPPRRTMEVLVVDNASADDTVAMVEAKFPWVKLIKSKENLGFSKGNNVAIRQCRGRYIALVNPDVIVFPGCLDALADFLDQHPKVGNVGPRVFNPDMTQQSTCRRFPTLWNNFCSATRLERLFQGSPVFRRRAHVLLSA